MKRGSTSNPLAIRTLIKIYSINVRGRLAYARRPLNEAVIATIQ